MTVTWTTIRALTVDECKADILTMLQSVGFSATSWQEGSVPSALVQIGALIWSRSSEVLVALRDFQHLDTAAGDSLTRFAASAYTATRGSSVAARYSIKLTAAATAGPYSLTLGGVVVTDGAYTYRNVDDGTTVYPVTLIAGGNVTLLFEAEEPGAASSVPEATIDTLVTAYAGVTLSNQSQTVVGLDAETDDRLRSRCRAQWGALSFETVSSGVETLAYAADPGITRVFVDDTNPRGAGTWDVYLASATGAADAAQVTAAEGTIFPRVFAGSSYGDIIPATEVPVAITGTIWRSPAVTNAQALSAVTDAVTTYLGTVPIGGVDVGAGLQGLVPLNDLELAMREATYLGQPCIRGVRLTAPTGDVVLTTGEVATLGTVTLSVVASAL